MFELPAALRGAVDFFVQGGFFMILLLVLSILSVAIIILRGRALRESVIMPARVENAVEAIQPGDSLEPLYKLVKTDASPLARIIAVCLDHLNWSRSENVEAVQVRARHEVARMESGMVVLEIATGLAPLLGLLGTLSGLVGIFAGLGESGDPVAVARGISEALNTTIVGLAVAAPSLVAHNYFARRIEMMAINMEAVTADLVAKCYPESR